MVWFVPWSIHPDCGGALRGESGEASILFAGVMFAPEDLGKVIGKAGPARRERSVRCWVRLQISTTSAFSLDVLEAE